MSFRNNSKSKVLHGAGERMTVTVPSGGCMQQGGGGTDDRDRDRVRRDRRTGTGTEPDLPLQGRLGRGRRGSLASPRVSQNGCGKQDLLKKKKKKKVAVSCFPNPSKCLQVK